MDSGPTSASTQNSSSEKDENGNYEIASKLHLTGSDNEYEILISFQRENTGFNRIEFMKDAYSPKATKVCFRGEAFSKDWPESTVEEGNPLDVATTYFKNLLKQHKKHVESVQIDVPDIHYCDMRGEKLPNLKVLNVVCLEALGYFTSATTNSLKDLTINFPGSDPCGFQGLPRSVVMFSDIFRVTDRLSIPDSKVTYDEFLRMKAKETILIMGLLDEEEINRLVKSWVKGKPAKQFELCVFKNPCYKAPCNYRCNSHITLSGMNHTELKNEYYNLDTILSIENRKVHRVQSKKDPTCFVDILIGLEGIVLAVNKKNAYNPPENNQHFGFAGEGFELD
ncbi:unnamed protein product [Caenorhabditis angaria]|uniref:F-box associated domain-containing protein n=1 Tax=Caenorhabditis angaria TaxID=860376 RepID=A0A9P1MSM2_9PELO|nr:unnamed protein product [Caenorhabditis angaria]